VSILILVILALVWAVFLLKPVFQSKNLKKSNSIADFNYQLSVLSKNRQKVNIQPSSFAPQAIIPNKIIGSPQSSNSKVQINKRRQQILMTLGGAFAGSFFIALFAGGVFWTIAVLSLVALGGYVGLLLSIKNKATTTPKNAPQVQPQTEEPVIVSVNSALLESPLMDRNVDIDLVALEKKATQKRQLPRKQLAKK
jgi:hypothetical protein